MAFLITDSAVPLLMETVPALKLTHYYGHGARDDVYAYLRCYILEGSVECCFSCFDAQPPETAFMALCIQPADEADKSLCLSVNRHTRPQLTVRDTYGAVLRTLNIPEAPVVTGGDEQGLYWSVVSRIPAEVFFAVFGAVPKSGSVLAGNLYLYSTAESAFASAFPVPEGVPALCRDGFGTFTAVPY